MGSNLRKDKLFNVSDVCKKIEEAKIGCKKIDALLQMTNLYLVSIKAAVNMQSCRSFNLPSLFAPLFLTLGPNPIKL